MPRMEREMLPNGASSVIHIFCKQKESNVCEVAVFFLIKKHVCHLKEKKFVTKTLSYLFWI